MTKRMVAHCGLVCTDCDGYIATQKSDWDALARLARKAKEEFGVETTAEGCLCDGCLPATGRKIGYCAQCEIRACSMGRGLENCGHCPDYVCTKLEGFFKTATSARSVLDEIRGGG